LQQAGLDIETSAKHYWAAVPGWMFIKIFRPAAISE